MGNSRICLRKNSVVVAGLAGIQSSYVAHEERTQREHPAHRVLESGAPRALPKAVSCARRQARGNMMRSARVMRRMFAVDYCAL
ncbi:hypothetical protein NDU88_005304 [Pleurodeles waltl]|uniref:Uncharacterized protein n=1 Tax=Pleurodeles waltl TaxID=8319 RepID=A0AAV7RJS8_PLEWA|nr:hypothetical protein NDU88_005304 [Pleurodeles waltl]